MVIGYYVHRTSDTDRRNGTLRLFLLYKNLGLQYRVYFYTDSLPSKVPPVYHSSLIPRTLAQVSTFKLTLLYTCTHLVPVYTYFIVCTNGPHRNSQETYDLSRSVN